MILSRCVLLFGVVLFSCGGGSAPAPGQTPPPAGWAAKKPMLHGRGEAAVAQGGGKIFVAGGYNTSTSLQIYDVAGDTWTDGPDLPEGTDNAGAVVQDGKLYVFGGEAGSALFVFDIAGNTWSRGAFLPSVRFSSVVEPLGGQVHLAGGWSFDRNNNVSIDGHDVFDFAAGKVVVSRAPLPTPRNHAVSGVIGGKLYVAGGRGPGHEAEDAHNLSATEAYDQATDTWASLPDLPTARSGGAGAVLGGKLYVLGGGLPFNTIYKTIERYDPVAARWEALADMPAEATGHRAVAVSDSLYVLGGFESSGNQRKGFVGITTVWKYTPPQ